MLLAPLQVGVPGGMAIVVFLFMSLVFWLLPLAAVVLIVYYLRNINRNVQRLVERREQ